MHNFYEVHQYELDVVNHHRELKYDYHLHNEFEILYLFEGEQHIAVCGEEYVLKKGDCAIFFPQVLHAYTRPDGIPKNNNAADSAVIFMPAEALYSMFPETANSHPTSFIIRKEDIHENAVLAFKKIFEEASINAQIGWAYIIFSHTIPCLTPSITRSDENADMVARIMSYISLNFKKSLTLDMISSELDLNKYYISRIFSHKIKISFRTYLGMLRSEYAASLIKISDDDMSVIASEAGFESLRSFYRIFKSVYGISPSHYRQMIRK